MVTRVLHALILRTSIVLAGSLLALDAHADGVYKWVDAQGQRHFGSTPPPGVRAESVATRSEPAAPAAATGQDWREQVSLSNQRKQQEKEQANKAQKQQAEQARRCRSARQALDSLQRGGARYRLNAQGEREYLSDNERDAERDEAAEYIAANCR